ncbi:MAG TPA: HigA family addiction module antitoxin [bacterium]|nr:HigA family addiction module antitoxin [bacterium]
MRLKRKPTHPGEILREDVLKPLNLTVTEAAKRLGITRKTLSALLNCRAGMSPEMAIRVGRATATSPESWLFMQAKLDLWYAENEKLIVKSLQLESVK